jgi:hypothetical protein
MLSNRQKSLIRRQRADEEDTDMTIHIRSMPRVGDQIEFKDTPEYNGIVEKISNDQWKMIHIDYGVPGHRKILNPAQLVDLLNKGKVTIIPASKEEKAKKELENIKKSAKKGKK